MQIFRTPRSHLSRILAPVLLAGLTLPALAADPLGISPSDTELLALPKACAARLHGDPATKKMWEARIGTDNFLHLHHFCFALNYMNRAKFSVDKRNKGYYLGRAIQDFDYVLKAWPANSPLRPDAEAGKKEAQMMLMTLEAQ